MARLYQQVAQRMQSIAGVQTAGFASVVPLAGPSDATTIRISEHPTTDLAQSPKANYLFVSPGYFAAIGAPLLRGRDISDADIRTAMPVAIINSAMAKKYWLGEGSDRQASRRRDDPDSGKNDCRSGRGHQASVAARSAGPCDVCALYPKRNQNVAFDAGHAVCGPYPGPIQTPLLAVYGRRSIRLIQTCPLRKRADFPAQNHIEGLYHGVREREHV
jgi:hypothetical protein